mmetsp:Transcript_32052/g.55279  ORF Transcript_32052/g.55279 Transcript_32052/m.55279 type:complete len:174 (+) Transcript_32052:27-548(+)
MLQRLCRNYASIPGFKTRIIDDFKGHLSWISKNKPPLAMFYFKNNWNPECSKALEQDFLRLMQLKPFESFVVDGTMGTLGERVKKYYCVRYEPSFLILSDGMELVNVIGSDFKEVEHEVERTLEFRSKLDWRAGISPGPRIWEEFHDEYVQDYYEHDLEQIRMTEGGIMYDRG